MEEYLGQVAWWVSGEEGIGSGWPVGPVDSGVDVKGVGVKWIGIGKVWNPPMKSCEVYKKNFKKKNKIKRGRVNFVCG